MADGLYPPSDEALRATRRCSSCGELYPLYDLSVTASLGAGGDSVSMPVTQLREICPRCGVQLG